MPITLEDPTTMSTAEIWCAIRARNIGSGDPGTTSTYLFSEKRKPLNDYSSGTYGGRKRPDVDDFGTISHMASDIITGTLPPTTHSIKVNNLKHFLSSLRETHGGNLDDAEFWAYATSSAWRLAGGAPRMLNYGFINPNPLNESLSSQISVSDIMGHAKNLFVESLLVPQRLIRGSNYTGTVAFPNFVDKDLFHPRAVPFALGPCIAKVPAVYGAVPAICLNEFTMADATSWVLGLLVGHDAKGGITALFQPSTAGDVGLILDADPDVKWPGQITAGWATINPSGAALVSVISGETFLLFAVKAGTERAKAFQDGSRPIFANFSGPTTNGVGTGTEMKDAHVVKPWALKNWIMRTPGYLTGAPYTTFPDYDYFSGGATVASGDDASFARSLAIANALGGIKWGGICGWHGDQMDAGQLIADMNRSSASMMAWTGLGNPLTDIMFDATRSTFLRTTKILDAYGKLGIQGKPNLVNEMRRQWFFNNLHLLFAYEGRTSNYVGDVQIGVGEQSLQHRSGQPMEFNAPFIIDTASANVVAQFMKNLLAFQIPSVTKWTRTWAGKEDKIGDGRAITHFNGNGSAGFVNAGHLIIGEEDVIKDGHVIHHGLYVDPILV